MTNSNSNMTNRDFYMAVMNLEGISNELKEFAAAAIEKMDTANEARRTKNLEKLSQKEAERKPLRDAIFKCITDEPKTASALISEAEVELKPQAIPSLLKPLIEEGKIAKTEVKITGKGKARGYVLA